MAIVVLDEKATLKQQVVNRAFVALAIEAGIETTLKSIVLLAMSKEEVLVRLKTALAESNPPLAQALGLGTLTAILKYLSKKAAVGSIVLEEDLPTLLDENGPASVVAARDGGAPTQINVTFSAPPATYVPEIYLDGVYQKDSTATPTGGFVNDALQNVASGAHTIRVLFRKANGAQTRFGPIGNIAG